MKTKQYKKRNLHKTLKKYKLHKKSGIKKGGEYSAEYISFDELKNFIFFIDELKNNNPNPKIDNLFDKEKKFVLYKKIPENITDWFLGTFYINKNYSDKFVYILLIDKNIKELTTNSKLMNDQIPSYINDTNKKKIIYFLIDNKDNANFNKILFNYPKNEENDINNFINFLIVHNPQLKIDKIHDTKTNSKINTNNYETEQTEYCNKPKNNKKEEIPKKNKTRTTKIFKFLSKLNPSELNIVKKLTKK